MVKPFSPTELTARMASGLHRKEVVEPLEPYVLGDLTIDDHPWGLACTKRRGPSAAAKK